MTESNTPWPGNAPAQTATAAPKPAAPVLHRHYVWDLPLRVFHWGLVSAVSTAIATGLAGGDWMVWHGRAGIAIIGLVSFRLAWGFLGSTHARFEQFLPTPGKVAAYLKGHWQGLGHNPLGALSVFALLLALAFQASTGLYGNDDIAFTGPLAASVSDDLSHQLTGWHRQFATAIYALLGLHLAAVAFYVRVKKKTLITPMLTGWTVSTSTPSAVPPRSAGLAFLLALSIAVSSTYLASGWWWRPASNQAVPNAAAHPPSTAPATPTW